jgi:hypothetical protein
MKTLLSPLAGDIFFAAFVGTIACFMLTIGLAIASQQGFEPANPENEILRIALIVLTMLLVMGPLVLWAGMWIVWVAKQKPNRDWGWFVILLVFGWLGATCYYLAVYRKLEKRARLAPLA